MTLPTLLRSCDVTAHCALKGNPLPHSGNITQMQFVPRDDDEDDDAEEDSDEGLYEVTCPNCGKVSTVDEETLLDQTQELVCPYCNASFDIELEGTEDEQPEDNDQ